MKGITFVGLKKRGWARLNLPEPYIPYAQGNFPTPSGKCEFYSEILEDLGISPLPDYIPVDRSQNDPSVTTSDYPLRLISPKSTAYFLNSSHANQERHLKEEKKPLLEMHTSDAEKRDIRTCDTVKVFNGSGRIMHKAYLSVYALPGVISVPHGWWPSLMEGGSSANALTPDGLTDLGNGSNFHDARVEVEKIIM